VSHEPSCSARNDIDWEPTSCICPEIRKAFHNGYGAAMDDGWGEPGHIKAAVTAERERIDTGLMGLRDKVAFGAKPGYRQGFIGCWNLVKDIINPPAPAAASTPE
jgi:hypothetical protein